MVIEAIHRCLRRRQHARWWWRVAETRFCSRSSRGGACWVDYNDGLEIGRLVEFPSRRVPKHCIALPLVDIGILLLLSWLNRYNLA